MESSKMVVFFSVFVTAFLFHSSSVYGFNSDRIVNGTAASHGMFSYLSALYIGCPMKNGSDIMMGLGICSSTIISKRHILTAAHCIISPVPVEYAPGEIRTQLCHSKYALVDVRPKEKFLTMIKNLGIQTKFYIHPSFYLDAYKTKHDIAIIEFPVGTDFGIAPVEIASNYAPKDGDMATAAGYGAYKVFFHPMIPDMPLPKFPDDLQYAKVPVHTKCNDTILCTANATVWADVGDSGGPLLMERNGKNYQIGVASFMGMEAENGTILEVQNFYTDVSYYCDWIKATTKGEASCVKMPEEEEESSYDFVKAALDFLEWIKSLIIFLYNHDLL